MKKGLWICSSRTRSFHVSLHIVECSPSKPSNILNYKDQILGCDQNFVVGADQHDNCRQRAQEYYEEREPKGRKDEEQQDQCRDHKKKRRYQLHLLAYGQIKIEVNGI